MLVGGSPAVRPRGPAGPEPLHPPLDLADELPDAAPLPLARVPALGLEGAEEALRARVVRAPALARHAPRDALPLAYRDPPGHR